MLTVIILLFAIVAECQQSFVEKYNVPPYDNNWTNYNKFWSRDVIIVVPDDAYGVSDYAENLLKEKEGENVRVTIKSESQLEKGDFSFNLLVLGSIQSYSDWKKLGIPVQKIRNGFRIGKISFTDIAYGFSYVGDSSDTAMRVAYIGNNIKSYRQVMGENASTMNNHGFKFHVIKNGLPGYWGHKTDLFDVAAFRKTNYTPRESKYFIFMLSKDLDKQQMELVDERLNSADRYIKGFADKMRLDMPKEKIVAYIHADQQQIKYMSGTYWALTMQGDMNGYAPPGDAIHTWGFHAEPALVHEAGHYVINNQLNKTPVTFISEGIQMWYLFTTNEGFIQEAIEMAKKAVEEDIEGVISGPGSDFQPHHYLVSGIFTAYLIKKYGIDKFKQVYIYQTDNIIEGFEKIYSVSLSSIVDDYRIWLFQDDILNSFSSSI